MFVDYEDIDNDLGCNYGVSRVLIMIYHRF